MTTTPLQPGQTQTPTQRGHGFDLRRHGDASALVSEQAEISYADLADRVDQLAADLGPTRRLLLLEAEPTVDFVATYLAALQAGHPVLLAPAGAAESETWRGLRATYVPGSDCELHPDLALLLSTSGSTGSPKLVRLSGTNVHSNAAAIADYLGITAADRAATSLPLHYCYGLSVLHSHLHAGASLWLTGRSVVDEEFWDGFRQAKATSLAGVPHTFESLDHTGFDLATVPTLRYLTQAGGRLGADRVADWAGRCADQDIDFVVMYGATEATARMAYLPPHLAGARPDTIGIPVPGGDLRIDDGELVYTGPNVMMGYATSVEDLVLGQTISELRTGDRAVQHDDGLFQITGRIDRTVKRFGVRIDLDQLEVLLNEAGIDGHVIDTGEKLTAFVTRARDVRRARERMLNQLCLPAFAVDVRHLADIPRTLTSKPDYGRLHQLLTEDSADPADVASILARILGRTDVRSTDSFVSLGGDSLSFVEASVQLERLLGPLPRDWPSLSITALEASASTPRSLRFVETPTLLRAFAIFVIVGSHTEWFLLTGGAHVLLALLGYNLARFQLSDGERRERLARVARSLRDLILPCVLWIGTVALLTGKYHWQTVLFLNNELGSNSWNSQWQFWFLEAAIWSAAGIAALLAFPAIHRWERRHPWGFALALFLALSLLRSYAVGTTAEGIQRYELPAVLWCVALGYLIARTQSRWQAVLATAAAAASTYHFFGDTQRELVLFGALMLLLWLPGVRLPSVLAAPIGAFASASLFIYLTHWQVYPPLDADHDVLAALASFAGGLIAWQAWRLGQSAVRHRVSNRTSGNRQGDLA